MGYSWTLAPLLALAAAACTRPAPDGVELHRGARVQFQAAPAGAQWRTGVVGGVGECTAVLVPQSWDSLVGFTIVRVDSLRALRVSTRYDGAPEGDEPRRVVFPPDTAGEGWTPVSVEAVRARYGGCEP